MRVSKNFFSYYLANNHENADIKKESASAAAPMFFRTCPVSQTWKQTAAKFYISSSILRSKNQVGFHKLFAVANNVKNA